MASSGESAEESALFGERHLLNEAILCVDKVLVLGVRLRTRLVVMQLGTPSDADNVI